MKTFVLTVSKKFPSTHSRKGEATFFPEMILSALGKHELLTSTCFRKPPEKLHTIRSNYELWDKRIAQIRKGEAILSIRYWSEKPYRSKQVEICQLYKDSGIGVQQLKIEDDGFIVYEPFDHLSNIGIERISKNDGLSVNDFKEWFKNYDLSEPMAIIHFSAMRY